MKKGFRFKPLSVLAKDETEARNTMKLLTSSNFINSKKWITKH